MTALLAPPSPVEEIAALSVKQQDSILDSTARINLWEGAIRSSKTVASLVRWLMYVRTAPPGPLAVFGKTRDTIARNVLDVIADLEPGAIAYTAGAPRCTILGRTVHAIGAHDRKSENSLRGITLAGAYGDELTVWPENFFTQMLGRLSVPGAKFFGTTNPDSPSHWLRKKYLQRAEELDLYTVHFSLADNPALTPEYIAQVSAEFTGLWYKRFILGLWVAAEGAIYDMLDEAVHCRPAPDRSLWQRVWIGIDYGTSNPTHAVMTVLAPDLAHGGRPALWIVSEWEHDGRAKGQLTAAHQSARLAKWAEPLLDGLTCPIVTVVDPSAAPLRVQMRVDGWPGLRSADNRVEIGLRAVSSLYGGHRLFIDHEQCPVLWDQSCGYVWDDAALERGVEQPLKQDDHGPDAKRYNVMAARSVWQAWLPELALMSEPELVAA